MISLRLLPLALLAFVAVTASTSCSGGDPAQSTSDAGGDSGFGTRPAVPEDAAGDDAGPPDQPINPTYPAPHSPFPTMDYHGGRILEHVKVVTVTFDGDALRDELEQLGDTVTASDWWKQAVSEYCDSAGRCVGAGSGGGHVRLSEPPPTSLTDSSRGRASQIQDFIVDHIARGIFPAPDSETLYTLYFPKTTDLVLDGQHGCDTFGGYHNTLTWTPGERIASDGGADDAGRDAGVHDGGHDGGLRDAGARDSGIADAAAPDADAGGVSIPVPYAILPRCDTDDRYTTVATSHEFAEAATDPDIGLGNASIAFYMNDQVWAAQGGEDGDLCADPSGRGRDGWLVGAVTVQRTWSPASAAASHDPCVPIPSGEVYFNAAPKDGSTEIHLKKGASTTIEVDAFSDAPMAADWTLRAIDYGAFRGSQQTLSFAWDRTNAHNGAKRQLTVTLTGDLSQGYETFLIVSSSGSTRHTWPAIVVQD